MTNQETTPTFCVYTWLGWCTSCIANAEAEADLGLSVASLEPDSFMPSWLVQLGSPFGQWHVGHALRRGWECAVELGGADRSDHEAFLVRALVVDIDHRLAAPQTTPEGRAELVWIKQVMLGEIRLR